MQSLLRISLGIVILIVAAHAHSWIDCLDTDMMKIYQNSQSVVFGKDRICGGYVNNYDGHGSNPTQGTEFPDIGKGKKPLCRDKPIYNEKNKRLQVKAGQKFYFGYLPNGHITQDHLGIGTYYGTYWLGAPDKPLDFPDIKPENLVDGTYYDYDDGTCGEDGWKMRSEDADKDTNRAGTHVLCVGEASLPAGTKPGIYDLVWHWEFFDKNGDNGNICIPWNGVEKGKCGGGLMYTSCYQVEVVADTATIVASPSAAPSNTNLKQRNPRPPTKLANPGATTPNTTAPPAPLTNPTPSPPAATTLPPVPAATTLPPVPAATTLPPVPAATTLPPVAEVITLPPGIVRPAGDADDDDAGEDEVVPKKLTRKEKKIKKLLDDWDKAKKKGNRKKMRKIRDELSELLER